MPHSSAAAGSAGSAGSPSTTGPSSGFPGSAALVPYGWDPYWSDAFAPYAAQGLVPGRVVRVDRGLCDLVTEAGAVRADTEFVTPRDPTRVVCTGDWVAVDAVGDPRFVRHVLPRRTAFVRSTSSKRSEGQVLATNMDSVLICVSLADELDLGRLERFLALALSTAGAPPSGAPLPRAGGARPVLVLTKADLVTDPVVLAHLVQDVEATAPGVPVLAVSAAALTGVDELSARVGGGTSVLLGTSGAGKSTLVNALTGTRAMEVGAIRDVDGKGRHTTTTRNLVPLPGGGVVIDTPGLRGVGLWDADTGVEQVFSEIEELARECRFQDCAHDVEPGCAVLAALEDGTLPPRRLESYRKLQRENRRIVAKSDARTRAQLRREWKARGARGRADAEAKRGRRNR
ncbi:ribosome small subunit-dependent GTPase A [Streptomyces sp. 8L]|uniref:ribosome small subunit-dependent GTPase A n=1 Tax=Streptomyces sp. 8L TaxID=2877242 RepID=UPI0035A8CBED